MCLPVKKNTLDFMLSFTNVSIELFFLSIELLPIHTLSDSLARTLGSLYKLNCYQGGFGIRWVHLGWLSRGLVCSTIKRALLLGGFTL